MSHAKCLQPDSSTNCFIDSELSYISFGILASTLNSNNSLIHIQCPGVLGDPAGRSELR